MKLAFALNIAFVEDLSTIIENQVDAYVGFCQALAALPHSGLSNDVAAAVVAMAVSLAASLRVPSEMA